jgi:hypothetical protein
MTKEMITFDCVYCFAENRLSADRVRSKLAIDKNVPIICGNCARLQNGQEITNHDQEDKDDFLRCIPYDGVAVDVPTGAGESVAGITKWTDANGKKLDRIDFILEHGVDPATYWINLNRLNQAFSHEVMIGQPPKVKLGKA